MNSLNFKTLSISSAQVLHFHSLIKDTEERGNAVSSDLYFTLGLHLRASLLLLLLPSGYTLLLLHIYPYKADCNKDHWLRIKQATAEDL